MGDAKSREKSSSKRNTESSLEGWSRKEKFDLLQGLKLFGSHDVQSIHKQLPSKTSKQIQLAINHYKSVAFKNPSRQKKGGRPRTEVSVKPNLPLSHWAKYLMDNISYNDLQTEIATALRLIAEFETIPQAVCTEQIDFRKAYQLLANAVEGKDLKDEKLLTMLITKCILETALSSKVFVKNTTVKQIVEKIEIKSEKDVKTFAVPVCSKEVAIIRHLAEQRNYNPLNISEDHLRAVAD